MAVKVSAYMKNVAKSFGYAMGDALATYNPVIVSLGKETKETASDIYQSIKSFSFDKQNVDERAFKGQIKDTIDDAWKNMKDDLKSGNWYNKARKQAADDAMADAMMKSMGLDFNFDFDSEDWGDFDDDSSSSSTAAIVASDNAMAKEVIGAVDQVGYKISGSIVNAQVESASYIVASANRSNKALYNLNSRGFGQVISSIGALNGTIAAFAKIGEPLTVHMQNSATFFTNTTSKLDEMNQTLHQIAKNTTPAPLAANKKTSSITGTFSSVIDSDGMFSLDNYKTMIKDTFGENKEMLNMALDAMKGIKQAGMGKNVSVMQWGTVMFAKVLIPKMLKDSMKGFNESLKDFIAGGIVKARNGSTGNLVMDLLKDIFLPKDGFKSRINVANYEKGAVSWDGYSRKALIEVIPEYLSGIYRELSGNDLVYNYQQGRFITRKSVQNQNQKEQRKYAQDAGGDFRDDALNKIKNNNGLSDKDKQKMQEEVEAYFFNAFMKGGNFYDINKSNFDASKYGLSEDSLALMRAVIAENRQDSKKRNHHTRYTAQNQRARDSYGDLMRQREANGTDPTAYLYNGFATRGNLSKTAPNFGVDEYGNTATFYLQGIYQYTGFLADNIGYIGGKSGKIKKRKSLRRGAAVQDIDTTTENIRGERTRADANTNSSDYSNIFNTDNDIPLDEDEQREKDRQENIKGIKSKIKNAFTKIFGSKDESGNRNGLFQAPFNAAAKLLDRLSLTMDKLIWGDDDNPEKGLFGFLFKKGNEFIDWIEKKFKIKDKLNDLKEKLFGEEGFFKNAKEKTKESLNAAGRWITDPIRKAFRKGNKPETAAHGRQITKSGIVVVSEGEMIIPSELNPFYHGYTNKHSQVNKENRIANKYLSNGGRNFWGTYASGSDNVGGAPPDTEAEQEEYGDGFARRAISDGFAKLGSGMAKLFSSMFGSGDEKQTEKDNKIIKTVMQKLLGEAGENSGAMGAGALIGAGVSIATGAVIGPVFGAAIGAATGLIANSKTVQHVLFGADPETGEVNGGLLPKNISNFMMKNVPSMAKGGALGAAAGLFMGSPILGAVVGAAAGYVSSSEKAKKFIFGDDKKDGLIPKDLQDKIKAAVPNMTAGAIAGLAIGPFGLVGNMVVGAGLGYLTTSQKFHNYMFGDPADDNDKGLAGMFKEKIFNNLDEIFHNIGNAISAWSKNLIRSTSDRIKDFFTKRARAYENGEAQGPLGKLIGGATSLAGRTVKGATNFVGNRLGGINSRLKAKNLKKGYNVYDRTKKRNLNAAERAEMRGEGARGSFANFDRLISNGSKEELEQLRNQLMDADDPNRMFKRSRNSAMAGLYDGLQSLDPKIATKIAKMVQKGDADKIISYVQSLGLSEEQLAEIQPIINKALQDMGKAKNAKNQGNAILRSLKDKGMKFDKGDLRTAIDRLDDELNSDRFSPEEQEKKETKDWRERVLNVFKSMDINIARLVPGGGSTSEDGQQADASQEQNGENSRKSIRETLDSINQDMDGVDNKFTYQVDFAGNMHKYAVNKNGEPEEVRNDSATDESRSKMDKFMESVTHIPLIGGAIGGISNLLGTLHGKLFGEKEEKKGLLSKFLDFLGGEDGPLKWITNFITGNPLSQGIKKMIAGAGGKITLGSVIDNVVAPTILFAGLTGKLDNIFYRLDPAHWGKNDKDSDITYNKETGESVTKNENGEYVDSQGNVVDSKNVSVRGGDQASFGERLRYNTTRGILTNTKSVASVVMGRTNVGRAVGGGIKTIGKAIAGDAGSITAVGDMILDACTKLSGALRHVKFLAPIADKIDDMFLELADKITQKLASESAKNLANVAANAVIWAKIAFIVNDFITGYEDARTTLGIIDEPSLGQRMLSGLLRAVKNLIPIVGTLIPDNLVIDVFVKYIAPALGINTEELTAQRNRAKEQVEKYNQLNGTNINSVGEFNKSVLKDYTWTERVGNAAKSTWNDTKDRFNNMKEGIKEKGLFGYMGDSVKSMAGDFMTSYKESGGGVAGIFSGIGTTFSNLLPGVLGEIAQKNMQIRSLAAKGQLKELWGVSLNDFSGGGEKVEGLDDVTTAVPSIFSKAIGQIPLIVSKVTMTPVALVAGIFGKIKDLFGGIIDKVKNFGKFVIDEKKKGFEIISNPDSNFSDIFKFDEEDEENPLGGVAKAVAVMNRLTMVPFGLVKRVGTNIANGVKNIIDKVKNFGKFVAQEKQKGMEILQDPNSSLSDMFNIEDDPENPLNGFMKGIAVVNRLSAIPTAFVRKIGNGIKDTYNKIAGKVKTTVTNISTASVSLNNIAKSGDPEGLWNYEFPEDEENPIGGFTKGIIFANKIVNTPSAAIHWTGNKIKEGFEFVAGKVKNSFTTLMDNSTKIQELAKGGKVKELLDLEMEQDEENPVGGFTKGIFWVNKITQVPSAGIHWVGNKIKEGFDAITKNTVSNHEKMNTAIENIKGFAKEGELSKIWKEDPKFNKDGDVLHFVWNISLTINKLFQSAVAIFNKILGPIKDAISGAKEFLGDAGEWIGDKVDTAKDWVSDKYNTAKDWVGEKANNAYKTIQNWLGFGGASGIQGQFVSQLDPKYRSMKFGDSTVGEKGCAPAVATMIANQYGKKLSMDDAINATNGFRGKEGTSADYFSKVLNSKGIATNYLTGNNIPGQIMQNLANGQQVILLGKDPNNTSKKNSPFGPNGHYVVATGIDKNGNIIINDPESNQPRVYNKSILNSAKLGVGTNGYGSGTLTPDQVAQKAWGYFTSIGYSPAATAGILANLKAESGLNPAVIQGNGKGPAAGIAQWENYNTKSSRWKAMADYAASKGYAWTELTPQLEFINKEIPGLNPWMNKEKNIEGYNSKAITVDQFRSLTDPQEAAIQFEKGFERAGKPRMAKRLEYAAQFYKQFADSSYTGNYTPDAPDPNASVGTMSSGLTDSSGSVDGSSGSSGGVMGIISAIGTAFTTALGKAFSFGSADSSSAAVGGVGAVDYSGDNTPVNLGEVPQGKGNAAQKKIVQYAKSILGKDQYSQDANLRTRVGRGYSDCSSFAQWAYKQALGIDPGGYTGAQIQSPLLTTVDAGSTPNKDNLEAGDLLFFRSKSNNGRYKNVGHVEVYDGNGNVIGHGSGQGPKMQNLEKYVQSRASYGGPYIEARRYKDIAKAAGGSSGLLLRARPGSKVYGGGTGDISIPSIKSAKEFTTGMVDKTKTMLGNIKSEMESRRSSGVSSELVEELLKSIVKLLQTISTNTDSVGKIYNALVSYTNNKTATDAAKAQAVANSGSSSSNDGIDDNIRNLTGVLAAIAKG